MHLSIRYPILNSQTKHWIQFRFENECRKKNDFICVSVDFFVLFMPHNSRNLSACAVGYCFNIYHLPFTHKKSLSKSFRNVTFHGFIIIIMEFYVFPDPWPIYSVSLLELIVFFWRIEDEYHSQAKHVYNELFRKLPIHSVVNDAYEISLLLTNVEKVISFILIKHLSVR